MIRWWPLAVRWTFLWGEWITSIRSYLNHPTSVIGLPCVWDPTRQAPLSLSFHLISPHLAISLLKTVFLALSFLMYLLYLVACALGVASHYGRPQTCYTVKPPSKMGRALVQESGNFGSSPSSAIHKLCDLENSLHISGSQILPPHDLFASFHL